MWKRPFKKVFSRTPAAKAGGIIRNIMVDNTDVLLAASTNLPALAFLAKHTPGAMLLYVYHPKQVELLNSISFDRYPEWSWDRATLSLKKTPAIAFTEGVRARSVLAMRKIGLLSVVIDMIERARHLTTVGVFLQEHIYMIKRLQAEKFRAAAYDERSMLEYPYVLQYADLKNCTLKEAADEIILKAKLTDDLLAKTELIRLRYFQQIKEAASLDELREIREEFFRDMFGNSSV